MSLEEAERKKSAEKGFEGITQIDYRFVASGFPPNKVYTVWARPQGRGKPIALETGYVASETGEMVCSEKPMESARTVNKKVLRCKPGMKLKDLPFTFIGFSRDDVFEGAVISTDETVKAFAATTPFPIEARNGPCHVWVQRIDDQGLAFAVQGEGFEAGEEVASTSRSNGEVLSGKQKVEDNGALGTILLPGVKGKRSGAVTYALQGKSCQVTVEFDWGQKANKLQ